MFRERKGGLLPPRRSLRFLAYTERAPESGDTDPEINRGTTPPNSKTFSDDAQCVSTAVEALVNKGKEAILVAHFAGAAVASQAVKGLALAARKDKGLEGGISKLVFLAGSLAPEGVTIGDAPFFVNEIGNHLNSVFLGF